MKKIFILIFLCFAIASCDDIPNFYNECEYKYQLPLSKVVIEIIRYNNGDKVEEYANCYDFELIKKYDISYVKIGGNIPPLDSQKEKDYYYKKTFLARGNFCYGDRIDGYSMFYTSKFMIQSLVSLDDRPDLDPRNDGFITNLTLIQNEGFGKFLRDSVDLYKNGITIKTQKDYDNFKAKFKAEFAQNIDFTKSSILGILVSTTGCARTFNRKLNKTPKGYEFLIDDIRIGTCRQILGDFHFVQTPKISPGDVVTFTVKSRYL